MQFPSIKNIVLKGAETFFRFPLPVLFAIATSLIGMYLAGRDYLHLQKSDRLFELIFTGCQGVFLFITLHLFAERKQLAFAKTIGLYLVALCLLFAYFISLPEKINQIVIIRFFLLSLGLHALVSFIPFLSKNDSNGFWQFNKVMFLRFVTSALYSAVLYIGLALALLAIDNLFGVNIDSKNYLRLWIFITGIFNTWFFLSGIPKDFEQLSADQSYPVGLKVFSQYILLSLVTIYLFILYLYSAKILIKWELPMGWVSYLVVCFAIVGILSLLLLHPIKMKGDNKFVNYYTKWFYILLLPLLVLLFTAIFRRIADYGITENRYFIFVLALWLSGISLYLTISRALNPQVLI